MESRIIKILSKITEDLDVNEIRTSNNLLLDLGITSLNLIFLIVEIEKEFQLNIDILSLDIENFNSLDKLIRYINKCQLQS